MMINQSTQGQYLPFLVTLPDGQAIPLVGVPGDLAWVAKDEDIPLTALFMDFTNS